MNWELRIKNEVSELNTVAEFIETVGEEAELSPSLTMSLNLVLEEAISNEILYAYPDGKNDEILLSVQKSENSIIFTLSDKGSPFDPTEAPEADITLSAEDRPIGGLGIFLIRKIMDHVSYSRQDDTNILRMEKKT